MPKKRLVFQLVGISIIIIVISHMAFKYLSSPLATIRNQLNLVTLHQTLASAATNNNKWITMSSNDYATVSYVTTPNEDVARQLSKKLVEQRLAACVNIVKNVESIYEWKGKIEQDSEVLMIIKSHSQKSQELAEFVQANHPYDCPEVVTVKVDSGSKPYLDWIRETINKGPTSEEK